MEAVRLVVSLPNIVYHLSYKLELHWVFWKRASVNALIKENL